MGFVPQAFYAASPGSAIEPEGMGSPEMRTWHTMGWGYWSKTSDHVPQVDFYKFAFDARWMTNGCERWSKNHTDFLQTAFFNGVGFESWENVRGRIWGFRSPHPQFRCQL